MYYAKPAHVHVMHIWMFCGRVMIMQLKFMLHCSELLYWLCLKYETLTDVKVWVKAIPAGYVQRTAYIIR